VNLPNKKLGLDLQNIPWVGLEEAIAFSPNEERGGGDQTIEFSKCEEKGNMVFWTTAKNRSKRQSRQTDSMG